MLSIVLSILAGIIIGMITSRDLGTGWGIVAISPLNFGNTPAISMITPTMVKTLLATTLVVQIRPTFWL